MSPNKCVYLEWRSPLTDNLYRERVVVLHGAFWYIDFLESVYNSKIYFRFLNGAL